MRTHVSRIARARAGPGIYRIGYAMTRATSEALLLRSARTSYSRVCVCVECMREMASDKPELFAL